MSPIHLIGNFWDFISWEPTRRVRRRGIHMVYHRYTAWVNCQYILDVYQRILPNTSRLARGWLLGTVCVKSAEVRLVYRLVCTFRAPPGTSSRWCTCSILAVNRRACESLVREYVNDTTCILKVLYIVIEYVQNTCLVSVQITTHSRCVYCQFSKRTGM
jgi:hypothetical protein